MASFRSAIVARGALGCAAILAAILATATPAAGEDSLVGHWTFEEMVDGSIKPAAGEAGAFRVDGAPVLMKKPQEQDAQLFFGRGRSLATLPAAPALDPADGSFTVVMRLGIADARGTRRILAKGNTAAANEAGWSVYVADGRLCWRVADGDQLALTSTPLPRAATAIHFVGVIDRENGKLVAYVNGSTEGWQEGDGAGGAGKAAFNGLAAIESPRDLTLGADPDGANPFVGTVDDLRLYRSAMTRQQVVALVAGNNPPAAQPAPTPPQPPAGAVPGLPAPGVATPQPPAPGTTPPASPAPAPASPGGGPAPPAVSAYYDQVESAYLLADYDTVLTLEKQFAANRKDLTGRQPANAQQMFRRAREGFPAWWKSTSSGSNVSFNAEIWGRKFIANYVPSEELGLQAPVDIRGGKIVVVVTWRPTMVNSETPAVGDLAESASYRERDMGRTIVWHELGHNYITNFLPLEHVLELYRNHRMLFGALQEFYADLTAIYHAPPPSRRLTLHFRLNELGTYAEGKPLSRPKVVIFERPYDETEPHTRAAHAVGALLLAEVLKNPDKWPAFRFPPTVPKQQAELNAIRYMYETMNTRWTFEQDEQLREFVNNWVRTHGDKALRSKGTIVLPSGKEMKILAADDRELQKERDAWVAQRLQQLIDSGRADKEAPEVGRKIHVPGTPYILIRRSGG